MDSISLNIDLLKFRKSFITTINGVQCVVVPIEHNDLFVSRDQQGGVKGVYTNLVAWAKKDGKDQYGKTHNVKFSMSQNFESRLPQDERTYFKDTFFGNGKVIERKGQAPSQGAPQAPYVAPAPYVDESGFQTSDAPF